MNVPCAEVYEFLLDGFTNKQNKKQMYTHNFNRIKDTPLNECGLIKVKNTMIKNIKIPSQYGQNTNFRNSCDLISSDGEEVEDEYDTTISDDQKLHTVVDYHKMYLELYAKDDNIISKYYTKSKKDGFNELIKTMTEKNISYINYYLKKDLNFDNIDSFQNDALIYNVNVTSTEKIIVMGDLHGSFHTFFRHMLRFAKMGILNLETYEISDGYIIIFLGDILDRGSNAVEILTFVGQMILKNNTDEKLKIIYNRGNHETNGIFIREKFGRIGGEIREKIGNDAIDLISKFVSSLPSAIIIKNNDYKIWLSHGGFPVRNKGEPIILQNDPILFCSPTHNFNNVMEVNNFPNQIRWNDFTYDSKFSKYIKSKRGNITSGQTLTQVNLKDFLLNNNINFVIRGHQDKYANSYLLYSVANDDDDDQNYKKIIGHKDTTSNEIIYVNPKLDIQNKNLYNGPIARILLNMPQDGFKEKSDTYYPVLTISTNTDIGRYLNHDSFIIIRFDLEKNKLSTFDSLTNIYDNNKERITLNLQNLTKLKSSPIIPSEQPIIPSEQPIIPSELDKILEYKYLKYKQKYLKLKRLN